ncbi:hypothetical protein Q8W71_28800 [Methylobacterium sp. NEAU 140]|uniref:hypothetical protein n=1 Tax=Methylobacterium sp. NEAU 140 TaxID=3064945 RepID=UPI002737606A|nr:hypothetical protein [Methylobacterium sp. NEAU 140]MDP4026612.1 hypothetical protein [Methylobacterium sp. NEAU 140]
MTDGREQQLLAEGADADCFWEAARATGTARANALKAQAAEGGLHFRAYLPPELATWLLDRIVEGVFISPSEAVFVMLDEQRDLQQHTDLRKELLDRTLQASLDDPAPHIPGEEFFAALKATSADPRPDPAIWEAEAAPLINPPSEKS